MTNDFNQLVVIIVRQHNCTKMCAELSGLGHSLQQENQ